MNLLPGQRYKRFFRDHEGRSTIYQKPNTPSILTLLGASLVLIFYSTPYRDAFLDITWLFGGIWAYLELRYGDSDFRRILGAVVFVGIVTISFLVNL